MDVCECGRKIVQPPTGRRRAKCPVCSPPDTRVRLDKLRSLPTPVPQAAPGPEPAMVTAVRAELAAVGRDATSDGLAVLALAAAIAAGGGTQAGLARLIDQFHRSKTVALAGAGEVDADVIDGIFGTG